MMYRVLTVLIISIISLSDADKPCKPRKYPESSVVCVCDEEHCDEISKIETMPEGNYVLYSSDKNGSRFHRTEGSYYNPTDTTDAIEAIITSETIRIPSTKFIANIFNSVLSILQNRQDEIGTVLKVNRKNLLQKINGFGGAFTDSAGINIKNLTESMQIKLIESYFGDNGLEYNMARVPIGGTDFSTHPYAYNEYPEDDLRLSNFSLSMEDFNYKIPLIQQAIETATTEVKLIASVWSPPVWMKNNKKFGGISRLLKAYYQSYADYHIRFLEEYEKHNITYWGITTGNEPSNSNFNPGSWNGLGWDAREQGEWIANNFGPALRESKYSDIKLFALDDQRTMLPWYLIPIASNTKAWSYVDGIATHWYLDFISPVNLLDFTQRLYPDKFMLSTEACAGDKFWATPKVALGDWERAEHYAASIFEYLNHWSTGWIDWNLALNMEGGPNWSKNFVDAPIIVTAETQEFLKQPLFYVMGHFSKFIPRDSVRVEFENKNEYIISAAFLRPDNGIAVILSNPTENEHSVVIQEDGSGYIKIKLAPHSFHSLVYW